jgi:hypothetical protein
LLRCSTVGTAQEFGIYTCIYCDTSTEIPCWLMWDVNSENWNLKYIKFYPPSDCHPVRCIKSTLW